MIIICVCVFSLLCQLAMWGSWLKIFSFHQWVQRELGIWMILTFCPVLAMMLMDPFLKETLHFLLKVLLCFVPFYLFLFNLEFSALSYHFFAAYDSLSNALTIIQQRSPVVKVSPEAASTFFFLFYITCLNLMC